MKVKTFDRTGWGIVLGLLGTLIGFLILASWWSAANGTSISYFYETVFINSQLYKDSILTVSVLFNAGLFWLALRSGHERLARGLMLIILLSVPAIIWIQSQSFLSA
tara:strand:- start:1249 stop:1569 length:321 start_codon:yes stop_codon:yes gene_type:complete